ncbi:DUF3857 domain-containing protein [Puia dinghuensis]|uniref:DUF3857 domain-containing protein n=1 Tax=Puia dinghuensis TaxID=1792502 RepID=A0A8J2XRK8_9BACT|nr:DUF3857 domain-containing protein [Puia dinghuensis]GGA87305.1 hypothetical protein GCM10011511_08080 [Puia dinghuensis]
MVPLKPLTYIAAIVCLCLLSDLCSAQGKAKNTWGKITPADFSLSAKSPIIDNNTNAVILDDEGSVHYIGSKTGWFSYVYTRQTRIKIINKKAFDLATISVGLYGRDESAERISNVQAATYNMDNGQVIQTKLEAKDVFLNRMDKEQTEAKFSLPGVKEGSIIEYTYTITSEYWHYLPYWQFQWESYPCLFSQYQVEIPRTLSFIFVRQGAHPYSTDKGAEGSGSYNIHNSRTATSLDQDRYYSINTIKHTWAMKEIPAFGDERFLTTPENYLDKIDFQLSATNDGETSYDQTNSWAKATEELLKRDDFGGALEQDNDQLNALTDKIATGDGQLAQAKAIYYYVSRHFTCTDHYDKYIKTNLRDVLKSNRGTVGDINLLLIAMLRRKAMHVDPVVLSTREHGFNLATYPILQRLNYVVARLKIDDHIYYLDAAHPQLGFGQLAGNCYNGHARIISNSDSASVWFWADSLKEKKTTMVLISNTDKGIEGQWQTTLGPEESYEVRKRVSEKGEQAYFKDIQTSWGEDMDISNGGIDSLDKPEEPIKVHYEFLLKQTAGASVFYLTPMLGEGYRENPYPAEDRKYPVEMPYTMDETYILSMEIPQGYSVDELPKSAKVAFNADQGYFEYLIQQGGGMIQMRCRVKLNRAQFQPEDYSALRDFFAFIVKKESEPIVLKKK